MVGNVFLDTLLVFCGLLLLAWIRNPLVNLLSKVGAFVGTIPEKVLEWIIFLYRGTKSVIAFLLSQLPSRRYKQRDGHGEFWDFFLGILFIFVLVLLVYSDYKLFTARVGPILFNIASGVSEQSLSALLGVYFVLTFLVIGFALSDAYGHVPGGSIMFAPVDDEQQRQLLQKVMIGAFALMVFAAILLGIWTVEKTTMNYEDKVTSAIFQVLFAVLALTATALAALVALIGGLAVAIILVAAFRAVLWVLGMLDWVLMNLIQKGLELIVAVIDLPASLGKGIVNGLARRELVVYSATIEPLSRYLSMNPLLESDVDIEAPAASNGTKPATAKQIGRSSHTVREESPGYDAGAQPADNNRPADSTARSAPTAAREENARSSRTQAPPRAQEPGLSSDNIDIDDEDTAKRGVVIPMPERPIPRPSSDNYDDDIREAGPAKP